MNNLAKCAGFDPFERQIGWRGKPQTKLSLALTASQKSLTKLQRWKLAARHAPATPAVGSFPYFRKETV